MLNWDGAATQPWGKFSTFSPVNIGDLDMIAIALCYMNYLKNYFNLKDEINNISFISFM